MEAQKDALNQALHTAQNHAQDLARRLDEMQQTLQERDQRLEELRDELGNAVRQRELQQQKHSEEIQSAAAERQRMAEQYAGNERHMLNEVDRARQELTTARKSLQDQERKSESRYQEMQGRLDQSEQEILNLHAQLQTAQNTAALAQERAADLKNLLEAQQRIAAAATAPDSNATQPLARRSNLAATRRSINRRTLR